MNSEIYIVLATFNGARHLADQIESLTAQTEIQWSILIRDDASIDNTLNIIEKFKSKDRRVKVLNSKEPGGVSASVNFSILLTEAFNRGAEYVFCCDQDDVWEFNKLHVMLKKLKRLEGKGKVPSLVHHDLAVVDESLQPIADSFIKMMQLHPSNEHNPQRLISRNEVTGCAMACNRALLEIALPISNQAVMHDWWLALCAGYFGRLAFVPEKLVKYRQHSDNTIGGKVLLARFEPFHQLDSRLAAW